MFVPFFSIFIFILILFLFLTLKWSLCHYSGSHLDCAMRFRTPFGVYYFIHPLFLCDITIIMWAFCPSGTRVELSSLFGSRLGRRPCVDHVVSSSGWNCLFLNWEHVHIREYTILFTYGPITRFRTHAGLSPSHMRRRLTALILTCFLTSGFISRLEM